MARTGPPGPKADGDPDVRTARQLAGDFGFKDPDTIRAAAEVLGGWFTPGGHLRFSYSYAYQQIAGPGIPVGPVVGARELGRILGLTRATVCNAAAAGNLPGLQVGKQWLFAVQAVWRSLDPLSPGLAARLGIDPGDTAPG